MSSIGIIINNKAKNSNTSKVYVEAFDAANIEYTLHLIEPDQLEDCLKQAINLYSVIFIGGGDGTIRTAAHYCAYTSVILGVLPLGTLNHFSKELGLPTSVIEVVDSLKKQKILTIDLAQVNGQTFVNNSSIGFYPKFADHRDSYSKKYNKWLSYIPSLVNSFKKHPAFAIKIKSPDLNCSLYTSFLMISNNAYTYEFPLTIKRERFDRANLGLYFFKQGKIRLVKIIRNLFNRKSNFEIHHSQEPVEVHFNQAQEVSVSLDGDTMEMRTPLVYKVMPKSLKVLGS